MTDEEAKRLFHACRKTLADWIDLLRARAGDKFPARVTAFHDEMAAHGKHRQPCPVCGAPIQRIVRAERREQLLRPLPDRRTRACRPVAVGGS